MVVSVCDSAANPYYNLFETDSEGYLHVCKGPGTYTRRQDAPPVLEYNGAVYVINPDSLRRCGLGEFARRVPFFMPASRSIDLDTRPIGNALKCYLKSHERYIPTYD